jgi:hypothetical protein
VQVTVVTVMNGRLTWHQMARPRVTVGEGVSCVVQ